jgi:hypothetical protein
VGRVAGPRVPSRIPTLHTRAAITHTPPHVRSVRNVRLPTHPDFVWLLPGSNIDGTSFFVNRLSGPSSGTTALVGNYV